MIFIGYHSTGAYKLHSRDGDMLVISRDVQVDESKSWVWTQRSPHNEQDAIRIVLEDDQQNEEIFAQESRAPEQHVRRSTRTRTQLVKLNDYERSLYQGVNAKGDVIE